MNEFGVGAEKRSVIHLGAPKHAHHLVGRVRFVVNAVIGVHLPIPLGRSDLCRQHEPSQVSDARIIDGQSIEVKAVPSVHRFRRTLLVSAIAEFVEARCPRMSNKPVFVAQVGVMRIRCGRIGEVAHQVHHLIAPFGLPCRISLGHCRCCIEEIAVMKMVVIVEALPEASTG